MRILALALAFVPAWTPPIAASLTPQEPDLVEVASAELEAVLETIRAEQGVPALGAMLVVDGAVYAQAAVGLRRVGGEQTVTIHDRWHLGPAAQPITATLVAALVERGEVRWDTTLGEAFGDSGLKLFPGYRDVPLELVLAHRAGLPFLPRATVRESLERTGLSPQMQRLRIAEDVLSRRPVHVPGTQTLYSNAGYSVVGAALEALLDRPFEHMVEREVLEPLGMASFGFGAPGNAAFVDEPWGHLVTEDGLEPCSPSPEADFPAGFAPAGTLHGRLIDWARFAQLHLSEDGAGLLSSNSIARMQRPRTGGPYALGWVTGELASGEAMLTHSGTNRRWFASMTLLPERDVAVLAVCNQGGIAGAAACRDAASKLLASFEE